MRPQRRRRDASPGVTTLAVPILRDDGIVAAIGVAAPTERAEPALASADTRRAPTGRHRLQARWDEGAPRLTALVHPTQYLSRYDIGTSRDLTIAALRPMLRIVDAFEALGSRFRSTTRICPSATRSTGRRWRPSSVVASGTWSSSARSVALPVTKARLREFDERAHLEAAAAPGFRLLLQGPEPSTARAVCRSACGPRAARRVPQPAARAHLRRFGLLDEMYERYTLEFLRVTGRAPACRSASSRTTRRCPIDRRGVARRLRRSGAASPLPRPRRSSDRLPVDSPTSSRTAG